MKIVLVVFLTSLLCLYTNCSGSEFSKETQASSSVFQQDSTSPTDKPEANAGTGISTFRDTINNQFGPDPKDFYGHQNGYNESEGELRSIPFVPSANNETSTVTKDDDCRFEQVCLVIRDNFERQNLVGGEFAWSKFLDDKGRNITDLNVSINNNAEASYGRSALYFTGRTGGSVHSLYIISKEFDLTGFRYVTIEFDYIMASFEKSKNGPEHLQVDFCTAGAKQCGLTSDSSQASKSLKDRNKWRNVFLNKADSPINQSLNGKNHTSKDYSFVRGQQVRIDLNAAGVDKRKLMLRWNFLIDEGLNSKNPDAGIIDNIVVKAYK